MIARKIELIKSTKVVMMMMMMMTMTVMMTILMIESFITELVFRVEAGSNTSTVTLRIVRGDEMGLKKAAPYLKRSVASFPPLRLGVRDRVCHVGFCGGQNGAGVGFL
jgi:hypothetical protein